MVITAYVCIQVLGLFLQAIGFVLHEYLVLVISNFLLVSTEYIYTGFDFKRTKYCNYFLSLELK